jgi:hypothetical protein
MPELARFYGIIIRMFWRDHPPPHFHAIYAQHEAIINILTSEIIAGSLPLDAHSLVTQWVELHRDELLRDWDLAQTSQPLKKIDPLP